MKKLVVLIASIGLLTYLTACKPRERILPESYRKNISEKCVVPKKFKSPKYISKPQAENWNIRRVKYHLHHYDIDGDKMSDMGFFFEFGENKQILNHPQGPPKFYAFDFNGNNIFELNELCERKIEKGKEEWYKIKPDNLPKLKQKMI